MAKGVSITLYDKDGNRVANTSGITAAWYDVTNINYLGAPLGLARNLSTDSNGVLKLDLSLCSGRSIGDDGYLILRKENSTDHRNSLCFQGRVTLSDVSNGQKVWYHSGWQRPEEWPELDEPESGTQRVQELIAVQKMTSDKTAVTLSCQGAYRVNWGDGSATENFSSGAVATHLYDPSDTDLIDTPYGYKCAVVEITPQTGANLTMVNLNRVYNDYWRSPVLDIVMNVPYMSSTAIYYLHRLHRVIIGQHNMTSFESMLNGNYNLKHLEIRSGCSSVTSLYQFCRDCYSLLRGPVLDGIGSAPLTTVSRCFIGCKSITSVPAYRFSSSTLSTASSFFESCETLATVPEISFETTASSFSVSRLFYICPSLMYIGKMNISTATDTSNCFYDARIINIIEDLSVKQSTTITITGSYRCLQYIGFTQAPAESFSVANNWLGAYALNAIFTALPTVSGKTITVTGNPGINQEGYDRTIATNKGWTVVES